VCPGRERMSLEIALYNAFTANNKGGNRAAIVVGADQYTDRRMKELASSLGAPATVFVLISELLLSNEDSFPLKLRFFTPTTEENICGHGTIAALLHLQRVHGHPFTQGFPTDNFRLETNLGVQRARVENNVAWLEYPDPKAWDMDVSRADIASALGLEADDLHEDLPIMGAGVGRTKLLCAVPSTILLDAVEPDVELITSLCEETNTTGVVVFTFPGRGGCFTDTRHFSFQHSVLKTVVLEDSATGNAHAALAAYLVANQFFDDGERGFSGAQGYAMKQPSKLEVRFNVQGQLVSSLWIGGRAVEVKE
jgi:PhzF family phenazine biosynthesis protein